MSDSMLHARSLRTLGLSSLLAVLAITFSSRASADQSARWSDRLLGGTTPGQPSTAKVATVVGLYTLAVASLTSGIVFTLRGIESGDEADAYRKSRSGPCEESASSQCHRYLELRRKESDELSWGKGLLGGGALFVLSGALTAELWPNRDGARLNAYAASGEAMIELSASF